MKPVIASPRPRRVLRLPLVIDVSGLSRATIYRLAREGLFPKPFKLGPRASAWDAEEIDIWLANRMRERSASAEVADA